MTLALCLTSAVSGAHLNPAVTLAFLLVRPAAHGMTAARAALYAVAQLVGAFVAGALNLLLFDSTIRAFEEERGIVRGTDASERTAMVFGCYYPNPAASRPFGGSAAFGACVDGRTQSLRHFTSMHP